MSAWTKRRSRGEPGSDAGFTLIEALTVMAIAGVLMAIAVWGMSSYLRATRAQNVSNEILNDLRHAGERSLSEGRTYCVVFTATTWTTYASNCTVAANKVSGPNKVGDGSISLSPTFTVPASMDATETTACPVAGHCAYFYPRGNALAGAVTDSRSGGKTYTITVEGVTGRVSSS